MGSFAIPTAAISILGPKLSAIPVLAPSASFPPELDPSKGDSLPAASWVGFDRQFHRRRNELAALTAHGVGCFYLGGRKARTWDRARIFMKVYGRIAETVRKTPRPFVCRIDGLGVMELIDLGVLDRTQDEAAPAKDDGRQPRSSG